MKPINQTNHRNYWTKIKNLQSQKMIRKIKINKQLKLWKTNLKIRINNLKARKNLKKDQKKPKKNQRINPIIKKQIQT